MTTSQAGRHGAPPPGTPQAPPVSTVREIHKNAWLKTSWSGGGKQKTRFWVTFCVHDDSEAFLEFYADSKTSVAVHRPLSAVPLNATLHVSPSLDVDQVEFAVTLPHTVLRLGTSSWDQMIEWVESLQGKLRELGVLSPRDNLYSKLPSSTRDPNSPLPPPPRPASAAEDSAPLQQPPLVTKSASSENLYEPLFTATEGPPLLPRRHLARTTEGRSSSLGRLEDGPEGPVDGILGVVEGEYRIRRDESPHTRLLLSGVPLKEQQALRLQTEIASPGGVRVVLRKKDAVGSIALVDYQGGVWVGGWKQRQHPALYYAFHVGDQVLRVSGLTVTSAAEAQRALRNVSALQVEVVVRRVPLGRVFVIKGRREGEPLGLVAEGNSGEICEVLEGGLASRAGLPPSAPGRSNWYVTEINNRPLSLVSREGEVKERLNAVGKEISVLVQPAGLVRHLRGGVKGEFVVG